MVTTFMQEGISVRLPFLMLKVCTDTSVVCSGDNRHHLASATCPHSGHFLNSSLAIHSYTRWILLVSFGLTPMKEGLPRGQEGTNLDQRFELTPEILTVERDFANDSRGRVLGRLTVPPQSVCRDDERANSFNDGISSCRIVEAWIAREGAHQLLYSVSHAQSQFRRYRHNDKGYEECCLSKARPH